MFNKRVCPLVAASLCLLAAAAQADMSRVYHPYVEQQERELDYGLVWRDLDGERQALQRLGLGYGWRERWFAELYLLTESLGDQGQVVRGYEAEVKWQLSEQGEYWADWGLLLELGSDREGDDKELGLGLLWEKELGSRSVAAANLLLEHEWSAEGERELETALRAQWRYRWRPALEPALELYVDEQDTALGPALMGLQRLGQRQQLRWELGLLFGLTADTPDLNLRLGMEWEF